jgi:hypothetical protein
MTRTAATERMKNALVDFFREDLREVIAPAPIEESHEYQDAMEFKECIDQLIEESEGVEFDWVSEYARGQFDRVTKVYDRLDDKAETIIKYIGGGTWIFTLAILMNSGSHTFTIITWAIPSFLCALASIFFASLARQPNPVYFPPDVKSAFHYAHWNKGAGKAQAAFLGSWHLACEGMFLAVMAKSRQIRYATWAFFAALLMLILPVFRAML